MDVQNEDHKYQLLPRVILDCAPVFKSLLQGLINFVQNKIKISYLLYNQLVLLFLK